MSKNTLNFTRVLKSNRYVESIIAWGNASYKILRPLIVIQNKILRICLHKLLCQEFKTMSLVQTYSYQMLLDGFQKRFNEYGILHLRNTRNVDRKNLVLPKVSTTLAQNHAFLSGNKTI